MTKRLAVIVALLAMVAACGGGGGGASDDDTTPAATSAMTVAASTSVMNSAYSAYAEVLAAITGAGAQIAANKAGGITFTCDEATLSNFLCTGTDLRGGWCSVYGSGFNDMSGFTMHFECDNFHPDDVTLIDGAFQVSISLYNGPASMVVKDAAWAKQDSSDECNVADDGSAFDDGQCRKEGTCTSSSSNLVAILEMSTGASGLTVTDACGTFTFGSDFIVTENLCFGSTTVTMGYVMNGSANGENFDYSDTWTCDYLL